MQSTCKHRILICGRSCVAAAFLILPTVSLAQSNTVPLERLQACLDIEDEDQQLACVDEIVGQGSAEPATDSSDASQAEEVVDLTGRAEVVNLSDARNPDRAAARAAGTMRRGTNVAEGNESILVVRIDTMIPGEMKFICDDERIYKQTGPARAAEFPDPPFAARIIDGMAGGSFLALENGRRVRVALMNRRDINPDLSPDISQGVSENVSESE
jgi:hypothetical protein